MSWIPTQANFDEADPTVSVPYKDVSGVWHFHVMKKGSTLEVEFTFDDPANPGTELDISNVSFIAHWRRSLLDTTPQAIGDCTLPSSTVLRVRLPGSRAGSSDAAEDITGKVGWWAVEGTYDDGGPELRKLEAVYGSWNMELEGVH